MSDFQRCAKCGGVYIGAQCPSCGERTQVRAAPGAFKTGALFHGLEILEPIGRGGMGVVYKARQPGLDRVVALKLLLPDKAAREEFGLRFGREARALASLSHANIVTVFDFGTDPEGFFFTMEYVDGTNLREHLKSRRFTPDEAVRITIQVLDGLEYAHAEGIVHRDIKPENILLDRKGRVKIADFGLAKLVDSTAETLLTQSGAMVGTAAYMSPEQMTSARTVDHRTDIYSTGIVLYEMLTGERPMGRFGPPSKHVSMPPGLDEVVLKALSQDPAERFQSVSDFKLALLQHASTVVSQPLRKKRSILPWILAADLVITIAVLAIWRPWKKTPAAPPPKQDPVVVEPKADPKDPDPPPALTVEDLGSIRVESQTISFLAFEREGTLISTGGFGPRIDTWEVPGGKRFGAIDTRSASVLTATETVDGRRLAVASTDMITPKIDVWDLTDTSQRVKIQNVQGVPAALAFNRDGTLLAVGSDDSSLRIYDSTQGLLVAVLTGHTDGITDVAFAPGGLALASSSDDGKVRLWDLVKGAEFKTLTGHVGAVHSIAFSPDGRRLVSAGEDAEIRIWNPMTGSLQATWVGIKLAINAVEFHPDGNFLAVAGADKKVHLWDVESGKEIRTLTGPPGEIFCLAFSRDGRLLASAGEGHAVRLWSIRK